MKIIFLGTSHGIAEQGRFRTSMILETNSFSYIIDLGAPIGTLMKDRGISFESVRAAFITHMHSDHALNINEYIEWCNWLDEERSLYLPEKNDIKAVEDWIYATHCEELCARGKCVLKNVCEGKFYDDGNIAVTAIETHHLKRGKSFAYMVEGEGKKLLFTGDLQDSFANFPEIAREEDFDAIVCELTHFDVGNALSALNNARTKRIIFNHVRDDKIAALQSCGDTVKFNYHIANDGDIIMV